MRSNYRSSRDRKNGSTRLYIVTAAVFVLSFLCIAVVSAKADEKFSMPDAGSSLPRFTASETLLAEPVGESFAVCPGVADKTESRDGESDGEEDKFKKFEDGEIENEKYIELYSMEMPFEEEFREYDAKEHGFVYIDCIPFHESAQRYTYFICEKYGVSYPIVLGIIQRESRFQPDASNGTGTFHGLMQISGKYMWYYNEQIGTTDLDNPYQNIQCGVWLYSCFYQHSGNVTDALMSYNLGEAGAAQVRAGGVTETGYSTYVEDCAEYYEWEIKKAKKA